MTLRKEDCPEPSSRRRGLSRAIVDGNQCVGAGVVRPRLLGAWGSGMVVRVVLMIAATVVAAPIAHAKPKNPDHVKAQICGRLLGSGFCSQCGCKGGPGYRGPNESCVGWDAIAKCGMPPTKNCKAEIPHATLIPVDWPVDAPRQAPLGEDCRPIAPTETTKPNGPSAGSDSAAPKLKN
jgi:hypothetical protein